VYGHLHGKASYVVSSKSNRQSGLSPKESPIMKWLIEQWSSPSCSQKRIVWVGVHIIGLMITHS